MISFKSYIPYYKDNLRLALPVIMSQVGQISVQLADTAMVGWYGGDDPTPLAAVSFGTSVFYIIFITAMGLAFGLTPLVGEHFARGDERHASHLLLNGIILFALTGIITSGILVAVRPLMQIMGKAMIDSGGDASVSEVIEAALPYYDTLIWGMIPVIIFCTFKQFLEGIGNTRIAMVVIITCNLINIALNWILIFGKFGIEPMGAVGAGLATIVARCCMCIMIGGYVIFSPRLRHFIRAFDRAAIRLRTMWEILKVGIPIGFHMFMESSAFVVANILVLSFGAHAISAYQICTNMMQVTFMIVIAIGSANTILCSHIFGRGDFHRLRRTVYSAYHLGLLWCVTAAIGFVAFRYAIPSFFSTNSQVIQITGTLLIYIALFQIPDCLQALSISALRGLQDVRVIIPIVFVSYVVINIPAGYLFAFRFGFGAKGLIMGLIAGLTCSAILTIRRLQRDMSSAEKRIAAGTTEP